MIARTLCLVAVLAVGACADRRIERRLAEAEKTKVEAGLVGEALNVTPLPDLPADCRKQEPAGVRLGQRLDVAVLTVDAARRRANARVTRCAGFYDDVKAGRRGPT